jgi:hypothetical protein
MRSKEEVALVLGLARQGLNDCEVARRTGIPRGDRVAAAQPAEPVGGQAGSVALLDQFVGPKR